MKILADKGWGRTTVHSYKDGRAPTSLHYTWTSLPMDIITRGPWPGSSSTRKMIALIRGPKDELDGITREITVKDPALRGRWGLGLRQRWTGSLTTDGSLATFHIAAVVLEVIPLSSQERGLQPILRNFQLGSPRGLNKPNWVLVLIRDQLLTLILRGFFSSSSTSHPAEGKPKHNFPLPFPPPYSEGSIKQILTLVNGSHAVLSLLQSNLGKDC